MSSQFQKKSANVLATGIIGLIVISFMFTGYETVKGTPDTVATVGDLPIKFDEYQREYSNQIAFYQRLFGGKSLTQQQIQQFDIKNAAIRNIVQRKLMLKLADKLGAGASDKDVAEEIKNLPYFQVNGQFSVDQYKQILAYNKIDIKVFEEDIRNQVKDKVAREIINEFPVSNGYMEAIEAFKAKKIGASVAQFSGAALQAHLPVSKKELRDFLKEANNLGRVESIFKERKPSLDRKAEVHTSHILVKEEKEAKDLKEKATKRNFRSLAKKHSTEPNAKESGGDLPPFSKSGRMVPEFEKAAFEMKVGEIKGPIKTQFGYHLIYLRKKTPEKLAKFDDYKDKIAKELIRKQKTGELQAKNDEMKQRLKGLMNSRSYSQIQKLADKYSFAFNKNVTIDPFNGSSGNAALAEEDLDMVFKNGLDQNKSYTFSSNGNITVVQTFPYKKKKSDSQNLDLEKEKNGLKTVFARKVTQKALEEIQKNLKVKVYDNLIR